MKTVEPPARDGVGPLVGPDGQAPAIVSLSDVHGYHEDARSALLAVGDHPDYDPVVETGDDGRLHWAGNDYVLVFNGDLIDRGPANQAVLEAVRRLRREAGPRRVRVTVGNHEMALLLPAVVHWPRWFSGQQSTAERRGFYRRICEGHLVAAYDGYEYTYVHAGRPRPYDVAALNDDLVAAAEALLRAAGTPQDDPTQREMRREYPALFGTGGRTGRGPGAGAFWLDFEHVPSDAPPQIVGHTRHEEPTRKGRVVCQNVLRSNRGSPGGEAVLVETPDDLVALVRDADGAVVERSIE